MTATAHWSDAIRLGGLRRFAVAITVLNILGHTVFGFEQSWAQPLAAVATAYVMELLLEVVDARAKRRPPRFGGGMSRFVDFLLSAHITGLAIAMLVYSSDRLLPIMFATAVAIGSKAVFRIPAGQGTRHFLNPSNAGITVVLLLFPWVGIAPPYHFTENLDGIWDWVLPGVIVISGTFLNYRFTRKLPLIAAWVGGFALQGLLRGLWFDTPIIATWVPMSGLAFVLYTFYMVTDPGTTPAGWRGQVVFGAAVAATYGLLVLLHVVFGLFFALTLVSFARGGLILAHAYATPWLRARVPAAVPVAVGRSD